jgi:DNA-binding MarR family transcriptional regulator
MNFDEADALNETIRAIGIRHRALAIAALAPLGIHPGHKLLLLELESEGPRTQAQLAAASGYEPPTITLSVRQLETAGLVVRRPSPTDGRATIVELTSEGRSLLPKLRLAWRELAQQTVAGLTLPSLPVRMSRASSPETGLDECS